MKILIDTNVILDVIGKRSPFYIAASKLFFLSAERRIDAYITANMITDIYYISRKHYTNESDTRDTIYKLIKVLGVLDVGYKDCMKAFNLALPDYEDAMISACAQRAKCDYIITRDTKHFENAPVTAISPDNFLKQFYPGIYLDDI